MRLVKTFASAALAVLAAMAFVGATSASASTTTQLCGIHNSLTCGDGNGSAQVHLVLAAGTVLQLLATINVLCLGELWELDTLGLGNPQSVHTLTHTVSGCGTGPSHDNCTVTVQEQSLFNVLKTGLDEGVATSTNGRLRLQCANLGLDCVYDLEGLEASVGNGHWTFEETPTNELGGKFFCPDEGFVHALLETLGDVYVLQ
ncbi:MAG TPA: hypothetical protein VIS51_05335 [Solirubrobacterales bacterium]